MPKDPVSPFPRIFISAAEPSADRHGADLIRAIRHRCPGARFTGVAGPAMQEAGCEALDDWTRQSAMLLKAVALAWRASRLLGRVSRRFQADPFDLVILLDSPALHLPMAKRAAAANLPVLYYIAPQLWAWGAWRMRKVRQYVTQLAAILPFEEPYFRAHRIPAVYVGHPLIEQRAEACPDTTVTDGLKSLGRPVITCLPGSRGHVIREVLPGQIEVARAVAARHPKAVFLFAAAHEAAEATINELLQPETFNHAVYRGRNHELLAAADLALVASGTATLEVACHRVPMVVMYNGSKWGYRLIGRWLIRTPHLSLVNILAERRIVPEFMPYYTSTAPIAAEALDLLDHADRRARVIADLDAVVNSLGGQSASSETATLALELAGGPGRHNLADAV